VQPDEHVIDQGDDGDYFYVIESGTYDIFVKFDDGEKLVGAYDGKGSFGELALMYNMPRSATIIATSDGTLWAMERSVFRRILMKSAFKKRKMYESLIEGVPMLQTLEDASKSVQQRCHEQCATYVATIEQQLTQLHNMPTSPMKSAEQIAETKSSEGQECVSALEHDSTQRWTDMNASLTSSVDALKKDLNAQTNKLNECSEASVKEFARDKQRLEGALTQHLSEHCQQVAAQMQNEVSLQVALLDQTESNVQQELEMRKKQLDTFLADELKVDIPTGTTPQQRDFAYPRASIFS
ncbi:PREDICTED: protein phosphatase 2C and cyclic nucleotide-binding/kinase domain-containing protein-like, partial [Priapulus caudatus]|uniref:Protein phosphatase 2C and cyclic nucleotide-binding/kinase domain-containing protein-like n=1 Tax=Priapulus caudatus TaxID=37621 RepID=A0ABM1F6A0_PRICU